VARADQFGSRSAMSSNRVSPDLKDLVRATAIPISEANASPINTKTVKAPLEQTSRLPLDCAAT
jgi:hypothetical protein